MIYFIFFFPSQMDRQSDGEPMMDDDNSESKNKACLTDAMGCLQIYCLVGCSLLRECIKLLVNHRRFQQCILLAILINTLSMGIEYHNQVNGHKRFTFSLLLLLHFFLHKRSNISHRISPSISVLHVHGNTENTVSYSTVW